MSDPASAPTSAGGHVVAVRTDAQDSDLDGHLALDQNFHFRGPPGPKPTKPVRKPRNRFGDPNASQKDDPQYVQWVKDALEVPDHESHGSRHSNDPPNPHPPRRGPHFPYDQWHAPHGKANLPVLIDDDADDEQDRRRRKRWRSTSGNRTPSVPHDSHGRPSSPSRDGIFEEELERASRAEHPANQRTSRQRSNSRNRRSNQYMDTDSPHSTEAHGQPHPHGRPHDPQEQRYEQHFDHQKHQQETRATPSSHPPSSEHSPTEDHHHNAKHHDAPMYRKKADGEEAHSPSPAPRAPTLAVTPLPEPTAHPKPEIVSPNIQRRQHTPVAPAPETAVVKSVSHEQQTLPIPIPTPVVTVSSPGVASSSPNEPNAPISDSPEQSVGETRHRKTLDDLVREAEDTLDRDKLNDTGDIERTRSYQEDEKVEMEEDAEHEFKAVQNSGQPLERITVYCKKYIVSFLNANGGVLYFGVEDDGLVKGVPFSRRGRDLLRLAIDGVVSHIRPQVDPQLVQVTLVPVTLNDTPGGKKSRSKRAKDTDKEDDSNPNNWIRFVVEVHVGRGNAPVYLAPDGNAYFRRSGSVYRMDDELIQRRRERGRPLVQGNVPQVPKEFIGREKELQAIQDYLLQHQNSKSVLVVLHGLPMTGKSTLARQLLDLWASMWPDGHFVSDLKGVTSHYVNTTEAKVAVIRSVFPILQLPTNKSEVTGIYSSCFSNKRCILLLENVGRVEQIKDMLVPASTSAKSVLVIVTSRRDLPVEVDFDALSIKLSALDEISSVSLLFSVIAGRGPKISDAQAHQLVKIAGCMPLPVRMLAASVSRLPDLASVDALIQGVQQDESKRLEVLFGKLYSPWEMHLSPSADSLTDSDGGSVGQVPATTAPTATEVPVSSNATLRDHYTRPPQEFLLSLSVFPASFDLIACSYLWGLDAKQTGVVLQSLVDSNEIDLSQDKLRYSQNDLFRSWCQQKASELFGEAEVTKWKRLFVEHYLDLLYKCIEFYEKRQITQGLELLSLEAANFEATIGYSLQIGDLKVCAKILVAIEQFNAFFGSGEQRKWDKLKVTLNSNPEVMKLARESKVEAEQALAAKKEESAANPTPSPAPEPSPATSSDPKPANPVSKESLPSSKPEEKVESKPAKAV